MSSNFVIIGQDPVTKDFWFHEREDNNGQPGKIVCMGDGRGDVKGTVDRYVEKGFDPSKIIVNGQPAKDVFENNKPSFTGNPNKNDQVKYKKTNFFKNLGTVLGGAMLIPATLEMATQRGLTTNIFKNFIKTGPTTGDYLLGAAMKEGIGKKIFNGALKVFEKSKAARIGYVAGACAIAAGVYMGLGRLLGAGPDAIINKIREHKAEKSK